MLDEQNGIVIPIARMSWCVASFLAPHVGVHVQIVSEAAMRLPEEVYRADGKGTRQAEGELTHEERRRRRAQHKRAFKGKTQQQVQPCSLTSWASYLSSTGG